MAILLVVESLICSPGGLHPISILFPYTTLFRSHLQVLNGLTLNGVLTMSDAGHTSADFVGDQTFSKSAHLNSSHTDKSYDVFYSVNRTLTIGRAITIRGGGGTVGNPGLPLSNQG